MPPKHWIPNLSNLRYGGSLQVVSSFIQELLPYPNKPILFLSPSSKKEISPEILNQFTHYIFDFSPAKSRSSRKKILALSQELTPDFVFTLFGPAYIKFQRSHESHTPIKSPLSRSVQQEKFMRV